MCEGEKQREEGIETNFSWNLSWPHSYWHRIAEGHRSTKATRATTLHTHQTYNTCTFQHKEEGVTLLSENHPKWRAQLSISPLTLTSAGTTTLGQLTGLEWAAPSTKCSQHCWPGAGAGRIGFPEPGSSGIRAEPAQLRDTQTRLPQHQQKECFSTREKIN